MPLQILIARHAKSSWSDSSLSDHDRPLNKRGLRDAPRMATWLADHDLLPSVVLSSSAVRALTTARIFCEQWNVAGLEPVVTESFYLASPIAYLDELARLTGGIETAMVVGHNPGLEYLVEELTGNDEIMPTAAVAQICLKTDQWSEISGDLGRCELVNVFRPKEIFEA